MADAKEEPELKKLYLSDTDKKLSGVCGGIAEYLGVDSTVIRLLWVTGTVVTGVIPGLLAYVIVAVVIPHKPAA